jgi:thioredoxin 1
MSTINIADESFTDIVLLSNTPTLVLYWAEWSGPSKAIIPIIENISNTYQGKLKVCKLNADDGQSNMTTYGVRSLPTLILFKDGKAYSQKVGAQPEGVLTQWLDSSLL